MSISIPSILFPNPTPEYSQSHQSEIFRSINIFTEQLRSINNITLSSLNLKDLPRNNIGLRIGDVFQVDGVLLITVTHKPYTAGNEATVSVGNVTVGT